jgi:hypothetical protein
MSPLAEFDRRLEQIIRDFALRILVPRWTEFDAVWETANKICDRYDLGNTNPERRSTSLCNPLQLQLFMPEPTASSPEFSSSDVPAQIPPPVAASPDSREYESASAPL